MNKHTVLLTSALYTNYGIYTAKDRIAQTIETAKSARKYLPGSTIILIDNSTTQVQFDTSPEFEQLLELVDYYIDHSDDPDIKNFHANVTNYDIGKNAMEAVGMLKALTYLSQDKSIIEEINASSRIFKLSGRYQITDKFDITKFDNDQTKGKYVFKKSQPSWIPEADTGVNTLYQTRLYSFTPDLMGETIKIFENIINNMFNTLNQQKYIDVEHSMSKFLPKDKIVELDVVGLQGNIAPNGMMVID